MKKYLFLLFFLLIPIVHANSIPISGMYNVYLDDKLLEDFNLSIAFCQDSEPFGMNLSNFKSLYYDDEKNCTWFVAKFGQECNVNPCTLYSTIEDNKIYLVTPDKTILTDEIIGSKHGQYDMFIHSDGSVEFTFLKNVNTGYGRSFLAVLVFIILPLLLNAVLEIAVAFFYFRKKLIPYVKLWMIFLANMITYIPFILTISLLDNYGILIAEVIIVFIEASFYKATIKQLQWKEVFILSLMTNIFTVAISLGIKLIWF